MHLGSSKKKHSFRLPLYERKTKYRNRDVSCSLVQRRPKVTDIVRLSYILFLHSTKHSIIIFITSASYNGPLIGPVFFGYVVFKPSSTGVSFLRKLMREWRHTEQVLERRRQCVFRQSVQVLTKEFSRQRRDRWHIRRKMDRPATWGTEATQRFHRGHQPGLFFVVHAMADARGGRPVLGALLTIMSRSGRSRRNTTCKCRPRRGRLIGTRVSRTVAAVPLRSPRTGGVVSHRLLFARRWRSGLYRADLIVMHIRVSRRSWGCRGMVTIPILGQLGRCRAILIHGDKHRSSFE